MLIKSWNEQSKKHVDPEFHNLKTAANKYSVAHNYVAGFEKVVDTMTAQGNVSSKYVKVKAKASDKSYMDIGAFAFRFWKEKLQWVQWQKFSEARFSMTE